MKKRTRQILSLLLALAITVTCAGVSGLSADVSDFDYSASALNSQTIKIAFTEELDAGFIQYMNENPEYYAQYIHIAGGISGEPDAELDGSAIAGSTYVDENKQDIYFVLSKTSTQMIEGRTYTLWFDTGSYQLAERFILSANGLALDTGSKSEELTFIGTGSAASAPEIILAEAVSAREVRIVFDQPIVNLPLYSRASVSNIKAVAGSSSVAATYVYPVQEQNFTEYRVFFENDIPDGAQLEIAAQIKLKGFYGPAVADSISASIEGNLEAANGLSIVNVEVSESRDKLTLTLSEPVATYPRRNENIEIRESDYGKTGDSIDKADLLACFDFDLKVDDGRDFTDVIGDIAASFPDRLTISIPLYYNSKLEAGSAGLVTIKTGGLTGMTGVEVALDSADVFVPGDEGLARYEGSEYDPDTDDYLTVDSDVIVKFRRKDFDVVQHDGNNAPTKSGVDPRVKIAYSNGVSNDIIDEEVEAIVVENKYIKAVFAPGYGGRLISMIYKPTGNDMFLTNPVGVPYGFTYNSRQEVLNANRNGSSPFWSNWLMVWAGVFPTLPESEHGKYWYQDWGGDVQEYDDRVEITIEQTDDIEYIYAPSRFRNGATGIVTTVTYVIFKELPVIDMNVRIHNPNDVNKTFAYWTCTTLAPGASTTDGSGAMRILSPARVVAVDNAYRWAWQNDDRPDPLAYPTNLSPEDEALVPQYVKDGYRYGRSQPRNRYIAVDKLNDFRNYTGQFIGYGQDYELIDQADWWGAVNAENMEGVIRVGDNVKTYGAKWWLWDWPSSVNQRPYNTNGSARPYIELWAGISPSFDSDSNHNFAPGETLEWTETYLPTMGMFQVTNAHKYGAADVKFQEVDGKLTVSADVFSTLIGHNLKAVLSNRETGEILAEQEFVADAYYASNIQGGIVADKSVIQVKVYDMDADGQYLFYAAKRDERHFSAVAKVSPITRAIPEEPIYAIQINESYPTMRKGQSERLTVAINPADKTDANLTWTSSSSAVVSVSADGVITAVKAGMARITATTENGKTSVITVRVL